MCFIFYVHIMHRMLSYKPGKKKKKQQDIQYVWRTTDYGNFETLKESLVWWKQNIFFFLKDSLSLESLSILESVTKTSLQLTSPGACQVIHFRLTIQTIRLYRLIAASRSCSIFLSKMQGEHLRCMRKSMVETTRMKPLKHLQ